MLLWCSMTQAFSFLSSSLLNPPYVCLTSSSSLSMIQRSAKGNRRGSSSSYGNNGGMMIDKSKRQFRVGQLVRSEVASIIRAGHEVKYADSELDGDLRSRISVVNADVSPDLRQARITVSIISKPVGEGRSGMIGDAVVEKRLAYSWLVKNTKQIRHALAKRLKHMKSVPNLTFAQADVGAAVDVMQKIDRIFDGTSNMRSDYGGLGSPEDLYAQMDEDDDEFDFDDEDIEWEDMDDDDFDFSDDDE